MKTVIEGLKWRYATKKFDPTKKLSQEQLDMLLEAMRLAPSSYGLQPWKFIVVTNPEKREQLKAAGYGQNQITDASHLIVFAVDTRINNEDIDKYIHAIAQTRGIPEESLKDFEGMMKSFVAGKSPEELTEWAARQAYIALGVLISAGATEGIDIAPMEGFDPAKFDEILELGQHNLASKVIAAIGFRAEDDAFAQMAKVRYPKEEVVITYA